MPARLAYGCPSAVASSDVVFYDLRASFAHISQPRAAMLSQLSLMADGKTYLVMEDDG
jgi:hypothetical protein